MSKRPKVLILTLTHASKVQKGGITRMELTTINASKDIGEGDQKTKVTAGISFDFGASLQEASEKFTSEVVFTNFKAAAKITAQSAMRRYLEAGKTSEEITTLMKSWKPGVAMERVTDPVAALIGRWDSYSPAEQANILKKLKSKK